MTLSLHQQVEDLCNLLNLRRKERTSREARQQAYLNFAAAILDVPAASLADMVPVPVTVSRPVVGLPSRSRVA